MLFICTSKQHGYSQDKVTEQKSVLLETHLTIDAENTALEEVLKSISTSTKVRFSYITNDLPLQKRITLHSHQQPLSNVLDSLLAGTDVKYYALVNQVVLRKEEKVRKEIVTKKDTLIVAAQRQDSSITFVTLDSTGYKMTVISSDYHPVSANNQSRHWFGKRKSGDSYNFTKKDTVMLVTDSMTINGKDTTLYQRKIIRNKRISRALPQNRFSLNVIAGPGISYRNLTNSNDQFVNMRNADEKQRYNFSGGVYVTLRSNRWLTYRTGLLYFNVGEQGTHTETAPGNQHINLSYHNTYNYLSLPLLIGVTIGKQKLITSFFTGIEATLWLGYTTTFPSDPQSIYDHGPGPGPGPGMELPFIMQENPGNHSYNKTPLVLPFVLEASYRFNKGFGISFSPNFHYFLSSMYTISDASKSKPYYYGATLGLSYFW